MLTRWINAQIVLLCLRWNWRCGPVCVWTCVKITALQLVQVFIIVLKTCFKSCFGFLAFCIKTLLQIVNTKRPHRGWMKQYQQKENIIQTVPNRNVCVCVCLRWSVSSVIQYWSHCLWRLSDGRSICVISRWTGLRSSGTDRSELDAEMTPTPVKDVCVCVWRGLQCNTIYAIYRLLYFHPSMFLLRYISTGKMRMRQWCSCRKKRS